MADAPEFQRGEGTDALPYGQATEMNKAVAASQTQSNPQPQVESPLGASETAQPQGEAPHANPLFGPSWLPDQSVTHGAQAGYAGAPPSDLHRSMTALQEAASDPNSSPALRNLLTLLQYHANRS